MTDLQATSPPARPVPARGTGSATSVKLAGFSPLTALLHCKLKGPKHSGYIQLLFTVMAATGKSELMFRPSFDDLFEGFRKQGALV